MILFPTICFTVLTIFSGFFRRIQTKQIILSTITWLSLGAALGFMWVTEGRPPFKTFYETYILLSFSLMSAGLFGHFVSGNRLYSLAGASLTAILCIWAILNPDLETIVLPPALRSLWFVPHVMVYFLGYSFTFLGGAFALYALFQKETRTYMRIDHCLRAAFLLLTIGISFGALWADEAWGTYWGWDPKESWALVSVLAVAAYCHLPTDLRHSRTGLLWVISCTGLILFTYLGMHLLPTAEMSVHVYTS